ITKVELNRVEGDHHMVAVNEDGNTVAIDAAPAIGGTGKGMRPMQMLLSALGGCSSIDVISILKKQKQEVKEIKTIVEGARATDAIPSVFTQLHVRFVLTGQIDKDKANKAVALSMEKYCSVAAMMDKRTVISYSCEISNG
ncbi:MAG: OsmC family protein, partial [Cyclobacteriaceae bacterium]